MKIPELVGKWYLQADNDEWTDFIDLNLTKQRLACIQQPVGQDGGAIRYLYQLFVRYQQELGLTFTNEL